MSNSPLKINSNSLTSSPGVSQMLLYSWHDPISNQMSSLSAKVSILVLGIPAYTEKLCHGMQ